MASSVLHLSLLLPSLDVVGASPGKPQGPLKHLGGLVTAPVYLQRCLYAHIFPKCLFQVLNTLAATPHHVGLPCLLLGYWSCGSNHRFDFI